MPRSAHVFLLAFLGAAVLSAQEPRPKLPTLQQLDQFIQACERALTRSAPPKPTTPKDQGTPPKPDKRKAAVAKKPTAKTQKQAHRLARDLLKETQLEKERIGWYYARFKQYNAPGIFVTLYPQLTYSAPGETRWLVLALGKDMLPRVFRESYAKERPGPAGKTKDKEEDRALKLQCHSPQHIALRNWMINGGTLRKDAEAKRTVTERIRSAIALLKELEDARDEDTADRAMDQLAKTGEEWIVYPLTHSARINNNWTRSAANRLLQHFTGLDMEQAARGDGGRKGGRKKREEQVKKRWQKQAQGFVKKYVFQQGCEYCKWVITKVILKTGD